MDIQSLQYVLAIAKYGNFSEAAYKVSLSQSSLSKHLQKIEQELGDIRLFDRSTRGVKMTTAGMEFVIHATKLVEGFEGLQAAMNRRKNILTGCIRIGIMPGMEHLGLTSSIVGFNRKYPEIQIVIREYRSLGLLELLRAAEIDVAFVLTPDNPTDRLLALHPIMEDELVLVVNVLHPLAQKKTIKLKEADGERFIFPDADSGMYKMCVDACNKAGFTPNIVHQCAQVELTQGFIAEGAGVTIMAKKIADVSPHPHTVSLLIRPKIERIIFLAVSDHAKNMQSVGVFTEYILRDNFGGISRI